MTKKGKKAKNKIKIEWKMGKISQKTDRKNYIKVDQTG